MCCQISEYVDSFLKPIAQKASSYVKDTIDFVIKLSHPLPSDIDTNNIFLVTMDVISLYPNISHKDGVSSCADYLNQRKNKRVPTSVITKLIESVLTSNAMKFGQKIYHQKNWNNDGHANGSKLRKHVYAKFRELITE